MQKTKPPASVNEYIASFPNETKKRLIQLRKAIKSVAPKAEELISYGIAGYKYHGVLIYFAGWKSHISLYPAPWNAAELKKEMSEYKGAKGTIKFPSDKPLPLQLINKIVKYKLEENELKAGLKKNSNSVLSKIVNPSMETTKVAKDENKAQLFAAFSFLKKNAAIPLNNGINISNNEIIYLFLNKKLVQ